MEWKHEWPKFLVAIDILTLYFVEPNVGLSSCVKYKER